MSKHYSMTKPCDSCPFRHDVPPFLHEERVWEIAESLVRSEFPCHKTTDLDKDSNGDDYVPTGDEIHCVGALILLEKMEQPSQMMRIAERCGMYDRSKLDMNAPVFDDFDEMAEHHAESDC